MEDNNTQEKPERNEREEIFSNTVRAGKRTYFFDVKATRKNDYYLTITESKKRFDKEGNFTFEKHKIFLYKEDFDKFSDAMLEAIQVIKSAGDTKVEDESCEITEGLKTEVFSDIKFEDLPE